MATGSITKKPCCKCNKGGATFTCDGCRQPFCLKHASDHRQVLSVQLDNIGQQHDILKRDIDEQSINKTLLAQIDQWEEESIERIRSSADEARANLKQLTEESKNRLSGLMSKLSDELRSNTENDDYTEDDLNRWMNQLKELRQELEKPSEINMVEEKPSCFCSIKTKKKNEVENNVIDLLSQNVACFTEKFSKVVGPAVLSEDGCSAICTTKLDEFVGPTKMAFIYGRLEYSSGSCNLRLRLNTSPGGTVFFGIVKSSQSTLDNSTYGYWSNSRPMAAGCPIQCYERIKIQPNDEVLLILDCFLRKISCIYERSQLRMEMKVNQKNCPLPWKLMVALWNPNDKIEILNV